MTRIFTRWVKQKIICRVDDEGEIIDVIDIIDGEIDSENYELI